jgi:hypothetical protein
MILDLASLRGVYYCCSLLGGVGGWGGVGDRSGSILVGGCRCSKLIYSEYYLLIVFHFTRPPCRTI